MIYRFVFSFLLLILPLSALANKAYIQPPDYDSKDFSITAGVETIITHNLGGNVNDYVVYLTGSLPPYGEFHFGYGGCDQNNKRRGLYWFGLTDTTVTVKVRDEEWAYPLARVRIWRDPKPDFDSGWLLILPGDTGPLTHNVGGDPKDYVIDLQFTDDTFRPHQMLYGGIEFGNKTFGGTVTGHKWGAYWHSLTSTTVNVVRLPQDHLVWFFRGRIFKRPKPAYDSGWNSVQPATGLAIGGLPISATHNFVYFDQRDTNAGGYGINHAYYGGYFSGSLAYGSNWDNAYDKTIGVFRMDNDQYADELRVRIYRTRILAMPFVNLLLN